MASRRAIVGTVIGAIVLALGAASLISNLGLREFTIDEVYEPGVFIAPYDLTAPEGTVQSLDITAGSFELTLATPEDGEVTTPHEGGHTMEWAHGPSGRSTLMVSSGVELAVAGTLYSQTDWIFVVYDAFVMISGLIIMGFSAGFGKRKPRGF